MLFRYTGEKLLRTGVAIETRGFVFCTSGRRRETLKGDATVRFFEHVGAALDSIPGMNPNLFTEISSSRSRSFPLVDFLDTPGLVDGEMTYPFDVGRAICDVAEHVDLVMCFFDPIGQALCKRTMNVIERLNNEGHAEKVCYYMSKADEVTNETDRMRCLIQITQNISSRITNSHAFRLPTIFLPRDDGSEEPEIPNSIDEVCQDIDTGIQQAVQKNLSNLERDTKAVKVAVAKALEKDAKANVSNRQATVHGVLLCLASGLVLLLFFLFAVRRMVLGGIYADYIEPRFPVKFAGDLAAVLPARAEDPLSLSSFKVFMYQCGGLLVLSLGLIVASGIKWKQRLAVLSRSDISRLKGHDASMDEALKEHTKLYRQYFEQLSNAEGY